MDCLAIGRDITQIISPMVAWGAPEVSKAAGASRDDATLNLAIFLGWTSFSAITMEMARSVIPEEVADQINETVTVGLVQVYGASHNLSRPLLQNRYEGYWEACKHSSNPGGPAFNMAKYFVACCRQGHRYVHYERLIPDPDDLAQLPDVVNPKVLRQLKELKARGQHPTYPMAGTAILETAGLLGSQASALHQGVESLIEQHA